MLHMFTYAEITYLEITTFNELKSDLSNCFSATSTLVNPTEIVFKATPAGVCKNQMMEYDGVNPNYISEITISIDERYLKLDSIQLSAFLLAYNADQEIVVTFTGL